MDTFKRQIGFIPIVITPPSALELPDFGELLESRGLFFFLTRRDIKLHFQQTVIGFLWVVLQPLIQMLIFYVILGELVKVPTGVIPYHIFFLSAFFVWKFFSQVVKNSAFSLVGNIGLIVKSYFPRLAKPLTTVANALIDLGVSFLVLLVFLLINGNFPIYERVNALLEVGTGFNAELSGRENIFLNGSFLGMKTNEIRQRFDEIVAFSEVEKFIDMPVKYYSSGMFVRLAFSVAVHLTPEILLLDEVLSVGDAGFQQKSMEKMKELLGSGATIILVTHNAQAIREICTRAIWLEKGMIQMDGPSSDVVEKYHDFCNETLL
jgi:ABC-type dipeptide/oligopeptide/nickel transport system ATPase subunit